MRLPFLIFCIFLTGHFRLLHAQEGTDTLRFRIVSYNVENLFDCQHDSLKDDLEYLPDATRHWNRTRYKRKLDNVARTIIAAGGWQLPALVALCEVENDSVLRDLTRYSALREAGYRYIMTHSDDLRGINVALLYQRGLFKPLSVHSFKVEKPRKHDRPTRDILHVAGLLPDLDTLDVLVAHFPSRYGGAKHSEPYRLAAARRLKVAVDSIALHRQQPRIVIMGDFNDTPRSKAVREVLGADIPPADLNTADEHKLYHLLARRERTEKHFGSYKYQGQWELIDHLLVSGSLLRPDADLRTSEARSGVLSLPFLLAKDKKYGGKQPFRTYQGMKYLGGHSDHLPVYAEFILLY